MTVTTDRPAPVTDAFALLLVDADGQLRYQSPAVELLLGRGAAPLSDGQWYNVLRDEDAVTVREQFASLVASGRDRARWIARVRSSGASSRAVEVSARNLLRDPEVRSVLLSFRSVPE